MRQLSRAAVLVAIAISLSCPVSWAATCYGHADCRACKNCRYCGHCAKRGGSCGVCSPAAYTPPPRPAPAAKPVRQLSVTERIPRKPARRPAPSGKVETMNAAVRNVFHTAGGTVLETYGHGNLRVAYASRRFAYPATPFDVLLTRKNGKRWTLHIADGNPGGAVVYVERIGR